MNLDNVVVGIFKIQINTSESLNIAPYLNDDDYNNGTIAYTVHRRMRPRDIIYLYKFQGPESDIKRDFKSELSFFLKQYRPQNILDYAFFLDVFCPIRTKPTVSTLDEYKPFGHKVADDILAATKGLLLWNHQLEAIASLFYESENKVLDIRIGLNSRDADVENRAKKLMLAEGLSVFDVFTQRVINFTHIPGIKEAYKLYEALSGDCL